MSNDCLAMAISQKTQVNSELLLFCTGQKISWNFSMTHGITWK